MNNLKSITSGPEEILSFWYDEHGAAYWFKVDDAFDAEIVGRFKELHTAAVKGELRAWRDTPKGRLAEIIILDQFSRNIHRGNPKAFSSDGLALSLSREAIATGADKVLSQEQRWILYLPFMHSESADAHEVAIALFTELGLEQVLDYEIKHKDIIDKFGRYPHRNEQLGRTSTEEEIEFLNGPNSSF